MMADNTYEMLDRLVDTDPIALRDIAFEYYKLLKEFIGVGDSILGSYTDTVSRRDVSKLRSLVARANNKGI